MQIYTFRLKPGQDIRQEILSFAKQNKISAGSIVTCVGALKPFVLRMAGARPDRQDIRTFEETHEIVSLVGTFSQNDCHLHIALSDKEGRVVGGHLKEGSRVDLTAEIVIINDGGSSYIRVPDGNTGFDELNVKPLH